MSTLQTEQGGKVHTQAEYDAFRSWERSVFVVFPGAFLVGFGCLAGSLHSRSRTT